MSKLDLEKAYDRLDWAPGILSPSLFVIEAKALRMVRVAENASLITGFKEERDVSPISYLQFPTLVSCNTSENQIKKCQSHSDLF